ncbi:hypothetical protein [Microbulbifer sp.]|uniref:hypothetical protein n=1 Tax=Microbulbifer sp. TaxID=1908541 RepID=UPI0025857C14|nr:hypothetical protein [Microbulbifer sp.]
MTIPSKNSWTYLVPTGWDEESAIEHFQGKSFEEAFSLIEDNALFYSEDFYYMPKKPFQFYIKAFVEYLVSEKSNGDSDAPSCFLALFEYILDEKGEFLSNIEGILDNCLAHIAHNQNWYDADASIYGDFHNRVGEIRSRWSHA